MENNVLVLPRVLKDVWKAEYRDKILNTQTASSLMYYQDVVINHTTQVYVDDDENRADTSENKEIPKGYLIWHEMGTGKTMVGLHFFKKFADKTNAEVNTNIHEYDNKLSDSSLVNGKWKSIKKMKSFLTGNKKKTMVGLHFFKKFADKTNAEVNTNIHKHDNTLSDSSLVNGKWKSIKKMKSFLTGNKKKTVKNVGGDGTTSTSVNSCDKHMCNVKDTFPVTTVENIKDASDLRKFRSELYSGKHQMADSQADEFKNINVCHSEGSYCSSEDNFESQLCKTVLSYEGIQDYLKSIQTPPQDHKLHVDGIEFEFNDKIVVFDEAQHLVEIFRDDRISKVVRNWFFFRIRKAHRYLFLSGTPLHQKTIDLTFYMNLCEGGRPTEPLLPFSERLFHKKYFKIVRWKQILFGWIVPLMNNAIVKSAIMLFTAGLMTAQLTNMLGAVTTPDLWIFSTQRFDKDGNYIGTRQTTVNKFDSEKTTYGSDHTEQHHTNLGTEVASRKKEQFSGISATKVNKLLTSGPIGRIMRQFAVAAGFGTSAGDDIGEKYDKGEGIGIGAVWMIPILSTVVLCSILKKLAKYDLNKIHVLNIKKLSKVVGKYISFYTFKPPVTTLFQNVTHKIRRGEDPYSNPETVSYELRRRYPRELINKDILVEIKDLSGRASSKSAKVIGIEKKSGKSTKHVLKFAGEDQPQSIKLAKGPYLSGAKFELDVERNEKNKRLHFKTEDFKKTVVSYNFLQHFLFLDVTTGIVDTQKSVYFEEEDDGELNGQNKYEKYDYQYDIFGDDLYENDNFMKYGRVIGNLTILPEEKKEKKNTILGVLMQHPKALSFDRKLSDKQRAEKSDQQLPDEDHCVACLDDIPETLPAETPLKFINMLHDILQQKRKNTHASAVVYSSFRKNGTHAFLKFVDSLKEGTTIKLNEVFVPLVCKFCDPKLDPRTRDRTEGTVATTRIGEPAEPYDVLFLEPSMTTGISIHRGECLHIMEPIINPNTMDQLKARVNRYNAKGFDTEKKVRVILYECSAKKHINRLMVKMKHWSQTTDRGRIFWKRFTIFDQELSPDYLVQQKADKLRYTIRQLSQMLVHVCSLNHTSIVYSKLDHKNYIVEDMPGRKNCLFCQTQKRTKMTPTSGGRRRRLCTRKRKN
jgi:hypothetical protein